MVAGIEDQLLDLLAILIITASVGTFVAKIGRFPYTIALLLAGLGTSLFGIEIEITLSRDIILLVLLPPLLFEGAATTDVEAFRSDLGPILLLAVPGVIFSIVLLGIVGQYVFGFSLLIALLFGAIILPTDPVSVLALFDELGAPERLSVFLKGESLINDGVSVVVFSTLLGLVLQAQQQGENLADLLTLAKLGNVAVEIVLASIGGVIAGFIAGYIVYRLMIHLDEPRTELVLAIILAYGSFLLAEHYLPQYAGVHASGVIATVVAGLFIGERGTDAMSPQTEISIFNTFETAAFLANAFIFIAIGVTTPVDRLLSNLHLIAAAIILVLAVRAAAVYPILNLFNRFSSRTISLNNQHVVVWGGLHASIPIALALGLPTRQPFMTLVVMVYGVAAFSLVVQGLSMSKLLDVLDIATRSEADELYNILIGRARTLDAALDAADRLREGGTIPGGIYEDFTEQGQQEMEDLDQAISQLMRENPELRREELLAGERQILRREKNVLQDEIRTGTVSESAGERLLEEVNLKIDQVESGESTIREEDEEGNGDEEGESEEEAYEEFWRARADEFGLDAAKPSTGNDEEENDAESNNDS
jgi:CPA1 family monovalent cation:H+ antiporter